MITKLKSIARQVKYLKPKNIKSNAQKYMLKLEIGTILAANLGGGIVAPIIKETKVLKKYTSAQKTISWESASKLQAKLNQELLVKKTANAFFKKHKAVILKIMEDDKNCRIDIDKTKIAHQIVDAAKDMGADPVTIACIAKKETHFSDDLNNGVGKGVMQVTKIAVNDLFQRPQLYHPKFSQIRAIYKTPEALFDAIQKKSSLNIRVGTMLYLGHLKKANGDIKTALTNYNGSCFKQEYARAVIKDINKYTKNFEMSKAL